MIGTASEHNRQLPQGDSGYPSPAEKLLRISLKITTLQRLCDNWINTEKSLDQASFSYPQFLYDQQISESSKNKE